MTPVQSIVRVVSHTWRAARTAIVRHHDDELLVALRRVDDAIAALESLLARRVKEPGQGVEEEMDHVLMEFIRKNGMLNVLRAVHLLIEQDVAEWNAKAESGSPLDLRVSIRSKGRDTRDLIRCALRALGDLQGLVIQVPGAGS